MRKQTELSGLAADWIVAYESGDSAELERIVLRSAELATQPYDREEYVEPSLQGRRETEEIDQQLQQVADHLGSGPGDLELSEAIVERVKRLRDCPLRDDAMDLAAALSQPAMIRGGRPRQLPVSTAHASHPCPGSVDHLGVEHLKRGRFGSVVHADGYVFGTRIERVKRIRIENRIGKLWSDPPVSVEKRIFMVVA